MVSFTCSSWIEGIKQWIYRWLPNVEVVEPRKPREEIKSELKELFKRVI